MISGIILASGLSKRMGTDKLMLAVEGVPVIERVIAAASKSKLGELVLVCTNAAVASIGIKYGVKIVENTAPEQGQSNSVRLGVGNSSHNAEGFMFLVGDQPFINESIINRMIENFDAEVCGAVVPLYNGVRGNPVIFASRLREKLTDLSGDAGGRVLLGGLEGSIVTVSFSEEKPGRDIDTPEEYEALIKEEGRNG